MIITITALNGDTYNIFIDSIEYLSSTVRDEEDVHYNKYKNNREPPIYRSVEVFTIVTTLLSIEVAEEEYNRILKLWKNYDITGTHQEA